MHARWWGRWAERFSGGGGGTAHGKARGSVLARRGESSLTAFLGDFSSATVGKCDVATIGAGGRRGRAVTRVLERSRQLKACKVPTVLTDGEKLTRRVGVRTDIHTCTPYRRLLPCNLPRHNRFERYTASATTAVAERTSVSLAQPHEPTIRICPNGEGGAREFKNHLALDERGVGAGGRGSKARNTGVQHKVPEAPKAGSNCIHVCDVYAVENLSAQRFHSKPLTFIALQA